ncbi:MAG TPA: DUF882 domain-containing protein, partial [Pseudolabrys sp.]|nr:DUF882 domain-containing protein [Pseudolabrys sp.]
KAMDFFIPGVPLAKVFARSAARLGVAGLLVLAASSALQSAVAEGDTRTLTMHHVHTDESITITYMRDGHYVPAALKKLDWFLRDWRRNEETSMDPHLFDVLWQVYRETDATKPIQIICGYRAPATNHLLRTRSGGVAKYSQHILGKAMDFFIPGVPLAKLRAVGLKLQRGGVGFYPTSGSPFVHMDVGAVRHWPGISRQQLVKIFPHGRTVHIPSDGKPLAGYGQALAEIERRGNVPNMHSLRLARAAGAIDAHEEHVAELVAQNRKGPLVALVNSGRDNGVGKDEAKPLALASLSAIKHLPAAPVQVASAGALPLPASRPQPRQGDTSASWDSFERRFWPGPLPGQSASPFKLADADGTVTGSIGGSDVLAYASDEETAPAQPAVEPIGARLEAHTPRVVSPALADTDAQPMTLEAKSLLRTPMALGGQRLSSLWLRATMLTPSVAGMTVSQLGENDPRLLTDLLNKPARSLAMTFSGDPQPGMTAGRFSGQAVVFLATTRFVPQQTASLR